MTKTEQQKRIDARHYWHENQMDTTALEKLHKRVERNNKKILAWATGKSDVLGTWVKNDN